MASKTPGWVWLLVGMGCVAMALVFLLLAGGPVVIWSAHQAREDAVRAELDRAEAIRIQAALQQAKAEAEAAAAAAAAEALRREHSQPSPPDRP